MTAPKNYPWVHVVVYERHTPTQPIYVNVFGFETERAAMASRRRAAKEAEADDFKGRVIANRVRPVLVDGIDYNVDVPS